MTVAGPPGPIGSPGSAGSPGATGPVGPSGATVPVVTSLSCIADDQDPVLLVVVECSATASETTATPIWAWTAAAANDPGPTDTGSTGSFTAEFVPVGERPWTFDIGVAVCDGAEEGGLCGAASDQPVVESWADLTSLSDVLLLAYPSSCAVVFSAANVGGTASAGSTATVTIFGPGQTFEVSKQVSGLGPGQSTQVTVGFDQPSFCSTLPNSSGQIVLDTGGAVVEGNELNNILTWSN